MRQLACFSLAIALSFTASMLTGCATLFSGGPQPINVTSDPPGATYQYGIYNGKTPETIQASRGELSHVATFTLAGYEPKTVPVETGIQGSTWWDILFAIGFAVDFASGNAYKVVDPNISATLTPIAPTASSSRPVSPATALSQPPPSSSSGSH